MSKDDGGISLAIGMMIGVAAGALAAVLYAPKSGEETREKIGEAVSDLAQKYAPEITSAKKQALTSIDLMKYRLEQQYSKINDIIKANKIAKAKMKESWDFEVN